VLNTSCTSARGMSGANPAADQPLRHFFQRGGSSRQKLRGCIEQSELPSFFALDYCIIYADINKEAGGYRRPAGLQ
jgi:hypothetical protein